MGLKLPKSPIPGNYRAATLPKNPTLLMLGRTIGPSEISLSIRMATSSELQHEQVAKCKPTIDKSFHFSKHIGFVRQVDVVIRMRHQTSRARGMPFSNAAACASPRGTVLSRAEQKVATVADHTFAPAFKRGVNDRHVVDMARYFTGSGNIVRFIEFMRCGRHQRLEDG